MMSNDEYLKKRAEYMTSNAPEEVKAKAIAELDAQYRQTTSAQEALEDFHKSAPDLDDVGN